MNYAAHIGDSVTVERSELSPRLAATVSDLHGHFIFHNPGKVIATTGDRYLIEWPGVVPLWFDGYALKIANTALDA